jgi:hypothetical protein
MLPHFLDSGLTDGGEIVSLTRRPHLYPQEDSWYPFLLEAGRVRSIEKFNDLIVNWTRDLPACSIVPRPIVATKVHGVSSQKSVIWILNLICSWESSCRWVRGIEVFLCLALPLAGNASVPFLSFPLNESDLSYKEQACKVFCFLLPLFLKFVSCR